MSTIAGERREQDCRSPGIMGHEKKLPPLFKETLFTELFTLIFIFLQKSPEISGLTGHGRYVCMCVCYTTPKGWSPGRSEYPSTRR